MQRSSRFAYLSAWIPADAAGRSVFFEKSLRHEDDKGGPRICGDAMDIYRRLQTVTDASRGLT